MKASTNVSLLLVATFGLLGSSVIHAEQTIEQNPCMYNPAYCGGGQPARRVINIPSRYGAIALDGKKLILGSSENNLNSLRSAKKEALKRCQEAGGTECKIMATTRNGCLALALGSDGKGGGVASAGGTELQDTTEKRMLQSCKNSGGEKCFIAYSQCSRDPRYQVGR